MKKIKLGALEVILLTVMLIEKEAYGVRILNASGSSGSLPRTYSPQYLLQV